jgi:two-component system alkaline phosphatase synthesis response regulator PhoP
MAKILVVDDDKNIVKLVSLLLTQKGHNVLSAVDGKEGLAIAREEKPDLLILDIMMPELDGVSVSGILFQDPVLRRTPVLILSGTGSARGMLELVPNVRLYMDKPFESAALL